MGIVLNACMKFVVDMIKVAMYAVSLESLLQSTSGIDS